ncbi:MAG TPA: hypothetical protein VEQ60_28555 [Longimicrobium sp.]|nr:hypothetical protein [Longimicrobium sp.]
MDISRLRANWRPLYLGSVAVAAAASYLAWPALPRPRVEQIAFVAGWAAVSMGYALLAWRARREDSPWRTFDTLAGIALGQIAVYEAFLPGTGRVVTPAVLGMIVAGVAFGISLRATRRIAQPPVRALPGEIGSGPPPAQREAAERVKGRARVKW